MSFQTIPILAITLSILFNSYGPMAKDFSLCCLSFQNWYRKFSLSDIFGRALVVLAFRRHKYLRMEQHHNICLLLSDYVDMNQNYEAFVVCQW